MQATSLLSGSLEYDLLYPLLAFEQAPDLILQVWLVDGLHRGDGEAILVRAALPSHDEAWHQGVGTSAGATAGGVESGVTHKVQDLAPVKGKLSFLHQKVMPADGGDLLIQFLMDVFVRQLLPINQASPVYADSWRKIRKAARARIAAPMGRQRSSTSKRGL
jgi:hypothetical protein